MVLKNAHSILMLNYLFCLNLHGNIGVTQSGQSVLDLSNHVAAAVGVQLQGLAVAVNLVVVGVVQGQLIQAGGDLGINLGAVLASRGSRLSTLVNLGAGAVVQDDDGGHVVLEQDVQVALEVIVQIVDGVLQAAR